MTLDKTPEAATLAAMTDPVLLLHGLARTRANMWPIARALAAAGYEPILVGYPSRTAPLAPQVEALAKRVAGMERLQGRTVHIIGFSLGGVLGRALAGRTDLPFRVGRLVQIGAPNRGSRIAKTFHWPGVRHFFGPVMADLFRDSPALGLLPQPVAETGVIIGRRAVHPFLPQTWISHLATRADPLPSDGVVECDSADLACAADRIEIMGSHSLLPFQPSVIRAAVSFLRTGRFQA